MAGLVFADLPAVFRDAVQVARTLGMEWLWIDALCIFQGGMDLVAKDRDWKHEVARMGDLYRDAFVVIAAAASSNSEEPILGERQHEWLPATFDFRTPNATDISIEARRRHVPAAPLEQGLHEPPYTDAWSELRWDGLIYSRGWCFQELHLATRIIHFVPSSIVYQCKTHRCGEDQRPPYPQMFSNVLGLSDSASQWRKIVQAYSSRNLSIASDKLPAIAGIAKLTTQASSQIRYLAGIWETRNLIGDLLWQIDRPLKTQSLDVESYKELPSAKDEIGPNGKQVKECLTPSWSWASVNEPVNFLELGDFEHLAKVLTTAALPEDERYPYATVKGGSVTLECRILECRLKYRESTTRLLPRKQLLGIILKDEGIGHPGKEIRPDGPLSAWKSEKVTKPMGRSYVMRARHGDDILLDWGDGLHALVVFLVSTTWNLHRRLGLVVVPSTKEQGAWQRVGIMGALSEKHYSLAETRAISLV